MEVMEVHANEGTTGWWGTVTYVDAEDCPGDGLTGKKVQQKKNEDIYF